VHLRNSHGLNVGITDGKTLQSVKVRLPLMSECNENPTELMLLGGKTRMIRQIHGPDDVISWSCVTK
jgi:hypothetical protein